MRKRLGLLLVLIPPIASAAYVLNEWERAAPERPAPKVLEAPRATPREPAETGQPAERDDAQSQAPQQAPGEVIGVPMLA